MTAATASPTVSSSSSLPSSYYPCFITSFSSLISCLAFTAVASTIITTEIIFFGGGRMIIFINIPVLIDIELFALLLCWSHLNNAFVNQIQLANHGDGTRSALDFTQEEGVTRFLKLSFANSSPELVYFCTVAVSQQGPRSRQEVICTV